MAKREVLPIAISKTAPAAPLFPFIDHFRGFEKVEAVRKVFGGQTKDVLRKLRVGFVSNRYMYMGVRDLDGNLTVGTYHLKNSDARTLYLDILHELFHVKQFMDDRQYFRREHQRYLKTGLDMSLYFKSPIEVPAYRHAVDEAKRIGMTYDEICEYLKMGPVEPKVFSKLLADVGLERGMAPAPPKKPRVEINRKARIPLYPFTDYFKGFEKVAAVQELLASGAEEFLGSLKVEFSVSRIRMITVDESDGHLQVGLPYLREEDKRLLYIDILACLGILKSEAERARSGEGQPPGENEFVESFKLPVREARRLGLSDATMVEHLSTMRFMLSPKEFGRFLKGVGLSGTLVRP